MAPSLLRRTRENLGLTRADAPNDLALAALVDAGLPAASISFLLESGIPEHDIYQYVAPRRTLARRRASTTQKLTREESDRVERIARIVALADAVFEDRERSRRWLDSPKRKFGGLRPLDLIGSNAGARAIEETLLQAYYGTTA